MPTETTSILLASPREPSGGSWLINCLLELGVRVNFKPLVDRVWRSVKNPRAPTAMWQPAGDGRWRLHPRAEGLKKWLPIVSNHEALKFRNDFEALYVQDLPRAEFSGELTILFVRDPRDAIHSLYRRVRPDMTLGEFVRFPHPATLLDAIEHWCLFLESWLAREGIHVYRFEEYKADAAGLLARVVNDLGIGSSAGDIARAVAESTYEKACSAEKRYRADHPQDEEVAMRAGQVGEWKSSQELQDLSREIEQRIGPTMVRLGYALHEEAAAAQTQQIVSHIRFLPALQQIELPAGLRESSSLADPMSCPLLPGLLKFAASIDAATIRRARLHARESRMLLDNLQAYAGEWHAEARRRIEETRKEFGDGTEYHMTRIRELMASHRATRTSKSPLRREPDDPPTEQREAG